VVVSRLVVALQTCVAVEEKVKLGGVADARVDDSAGHAVAGAVAVAVAGWEEARIVTLLHHHKCDGGLVALTQGRKGLEVGVRWGDSGKKEGGM
jgi:hypothetical protein